MSSMLFRPQNVDSVNASGYRMTPRRFVTYGRLWDQGLQGSHKTPTNRGHVSAQVSVDL